MFDCHLHSYFSCDSEMQPEAACEKAISLELQGIAFTDHLDYDYPDLDLSFMIDFRLYSEYMDELKIKYKENLKILKGIEVGIQPHVIEDTNSLVNEFDFDFVISSTHIIDKLDPYTGAYYEGKDKKQSDTRYLQEILHSVTNFKNYDVIGHIGYIRRYGPYGDKNFKYSDYIDLADSILETIINDGKGIEVNTSGYRNGLESPVPDYDIVKRYRELGGEIVTIGSDAHYPEHIGDGFELVKEQLKNLGFNYFTYFEGRKPVFVKL